MRFSPRFVSRRGIAREGTRRPSFCHNLRRVPSRRIDRACPGGHPRRGLERPAARDRRPDRAQLRRDDGHLRRGRRRHRQRRPDRQGRGPGRHRLQVGGRHPLERALDPQVGGSLRGGRARRGGRRPGPDQGGPGGAPDPLQEAGALREGLAPHRGGRRVGRAGRGHGDRGRQGRPDPRPRRARLPARLAGRHPPRPQPRRVHEPEARVQGDRAQSQPQQRRPLPSRRARGGAQGGARADPRQAPAGPGGRGQDLQHRRLRRLRRPRRDRRPDPHLRAFLEPRQPSLRGGRDRRHRPDQGARHRPRPPADLARPQADPGGPLAAGRQRRTARATCSRAR